MASFQVKQHSGGTDAAPSRNAALQHDRKARAKYSGFDHTNRL